METQKNEKRDLTKKNVQLLIKEKSDQIGPIKTELTKKDILLLIKEKSDQYGKIFNWLEKQLQKKFKSDKAEYLITYEKENGKIKEEKIIVTDAKIKIQVSNKLGAVNEGYSKSLSISSKNFYSNLFFILSLLKNKKNKKYVLGYELPISTRSSSETPEKLLEIFD